MIKLLLLGQTLVVKWLYPVGVSLAIVTGTLALYLLIVPARFVCRRAVEADPSTSLN